MFGISGYFSNRKERPTTTTSPQAVPTETMKTPTKLKATTNSSSCDSRSDLTEPRVKTFLRVRPIDPNRPRYIQKSSKTTEFLVEAPKDSHAAKSHAHFEARYDFSRVLGEEASQNLVYEMTTKPLVNDLLNEKTQQSGLLIAFGTTNSGKTYTIHGTDNDNPGILLLALKEVFNRILNPRGLEDKDYEVLISITEIYNDKFRDLVGSGVGYTPERKGFVQVRVGSFEEAYTIYKRALNRRVVFKTVLNKASSRSHVEFSIKVGGKGASPLKELVFLDMAGCERQKQTEVAGEQLEQAGNINQDYLAVGRILKKLGVLQKSPDANIHMGYRDRKVTAGLQKFFESGKIHFLTTINPDASYFDATRDVLVKSGLTQKINKESILQSVASKVDSGLNKRRTNSIELQRTVAELQKKLQSAEKKALEHFQEQCKSDIWPETRTTTCQTDNTPSEMELSDPANLFESRILVLKEEYQHTLSKLDEKTFQISRLETELKTALDRIQVLERSISQRSEVVDIGVQTESQGLEILVMRTPTLPTKDFVVSVEHGNGFTTPNRDEEVEGDEVIDVMGAVSLISVGGEVDSKRSDVVRGKPPPEETPHEQPPPVELYEKESYDDEKHDEQSYEEKNSGAEEDSDEDDELYQPQIQVRPQTRSLRNRKGPFENTEDGEKIKKERKDLSERMLQQEHKAQIVRKKAQTVPLSIQKRTRKKRKVRDVEEEDRLSGVVTDVDEGCLFGSKENAPAGKRVKLKKRQASRLANED